MSFVTRFAPSPTGYLHLGHAFSALTAFAAARAAGGRFLLRIEDIDVTRSRPELIEAIIEDVAWLGINFEANSDDFVFDNEMLSQAVYFGYRIGEISCPTRYFKEASSINFRRSVKYGFGVLGTSLKFRLHRWKLAKSRLFRERGQRLLPNYYQEIEGKQ